MSSPQEAQAGPPLAGSRVVELTEALAGPACAQILGDLGADVVKVERPGRGDQARGYGPPFAGGESAYFMSLNRNKRSLSLDISLAAGQEVMRRLLARADVFLLNLPGQASWEKYGLGYAQLAAANPGLIMVAISGYGHSGPRAGAPGYDVIAQGEAGAMSLTGEPAGPPARFPTPMADMSAGLYATIGVLAALHGRRASGRGQLLDVSLLESQASWLTNLVPAYFLTGEPPARLGNAHPMLVPYRPYQARDGAFIVGVGTESLWARFCPAIGRPELAGDPRFATNADRVRQREALEAILEPHFAAGAAGDWLARLQAARIPSGRVNSLPGLLADGHFLARGGLVELEHPRAGAISMLAHPVHFSATPPRYDRPAPWLGEHNAEVLAELGFGPAEIASLRADGVI
ncbi:MAG: CaiB/BaiF CoA transferase family protein [Candidatus Promineifilaceae bacterium]